MPCFHARKNLLDKMRTFWNIWKISVLFIKFTIYKMIVQSCLDMLKFLLSNLIVQNKWYVDIFYFLVWLYKYVIINNTSRSDRIFFLQVQCKVKVDFSKVPRPFCQLNKIPELSSCFLELPNIKAASRMCGYFYASTINVKRVYP